MLMVLLRWQEIGSWQMSSFLLAKLAFFGRVLRMAVFIGIS